MAAGIANGGPSADMRPGAQAAFWIWRDGAGWHLRTTTKTELHVFTGRVDGVSGPIAGLQPTRTEFGDHMQLQNGRIVFSFATQGHEDGFSFTTAPNNCVTFLLEMDGNLVPPIHIGPKKIQPPSRHFTLCP